MGMTSSYYLIVFLIHAVMYMLDWQNSMSNPWKIETLTQADDIVVISNKNKMTVLQVVHVVIASLETTLSAAASVIFSQLLMSGDVEQNPGPGIDSKYLALIYNVVL